MLITHVKPTELWGKKVYDSEGHFLGEVVAIASRRGVARKVLVRGAYHGRPVRLLARPDTQVETNAIVISDPQAGTRPLRLVGR